MTKDDKNTPDQVFMTLDFIWSPIWENSGTIYFWDLDKTNYKWSPDKEYWVESIGFNYNSYWYDAVWPEPTLSVEEAKKRFPGSVPIVILTNKKKSAKRSRILRALRIAHTDKQVFEEPVGLPRGFGFTDSEKERDVAYKEEPESFVSRTFAHKKEPQSFPTGKIFFSVGPEYAAVLYHADGRPLFLTHGVDYHGVDTSRRFASKNEAQAWLIVELRKLLKVERAAAKKLKAEKEGEKNG